MRVQTANEMETEINNNDIFFNNFVLHLLWAMFPFPNENVYELLLFRLSF